MVMSESWAFLIAYIITAISAYMYMSAVVAPIYAEMINEIN